MAAPLILDTGPFVAIVHRGDRRHPECAEVLRNWEGAILTTEAVLTETLHLVGQAWSIQEACLKFFLRGAFQLVPASLESLRWAQPVNCRSITAKMTKSATPIAATTTSPAKTSGTSKRELAAIIR